MSLTQVQESGLKLAEVVQFRSTTEPWKKLDIDDLYLTSILTSYETQTLIMRRNSWRSMEFSMSLMAFPSRIFRSR